MPFDNERKDSGFSLTRRNVPKPVFVPSYNPNPESEDMGAPVTPAEALQAEKIINLNECCKGGKTCSCGKDSLMIQRLAWIARERGNGRTLFYILRDAESVWGKEVIDEVRRLVEEARFV